MSSNEVVKGVAKKLKYYFEIKRLEDGFDLSDVHQPQLDHPPLKVAGWPLSTYEKKTRSALQYEGLHDRALKHYFSKPDVRVQLTQLNGQNARGALHSKREVQVRKMLDNYMKHYTFQKNVLPSCYYYHSPRGCKVRPSVTGALHREKKKKNLVGGWPVLRTVPDQQITKGEAARLINSATKIICNSDLYETSGIRKVKKKRSQSAPRSSKSNLRFSQGSPDSFLSRDLDLYNQKGTGRPATASSPYAVRRKKVTHVKPKAYDDSYIVKQSRPSPAPPRPRSPTPSQSTTATTTTATTTTVDEKPVSRPRSAKYRSRTVINAPEPRPQEEVAVIRSTQTTSDYDVDSERDRQKIEKFDKLEQEVSDGPWCEYQVYVRTGNVTGAGTKAPVKLTMYGEKGRTKEFSLNKLSKKNKIPFQKGKEDLFLLPAHHIGRITKIQIGHDRPELNFAWYLENVTVFDLHAKRIFQFPCNQWLSGMAKDRRTYRILHVDREMDFINALDESMTKSPRSQSGSSGEETPQSVRGNRKVTSKTPDNLSTRVRGGTYSDSESDSTSDSDSSSSDSSSDDSRRKVPVRDDGPSPRHKKKSPKDDYVQKDTMITLHTSDSKQVDEIIVSARGQDAKPKPADEYVAGYKAALSASAQEDKKRLEREREMERNMLQGKSIHEAVKDRDTDRVKDLLHHFPEMRDFKDESSWTPLHLAAAGGNIELLKWLVTSDADINAETSTGYNAMHIAAMNGHVNSMMLLQAMGSSILEKTVEKETALHLAAKSGHLECVKWLVANRAPLQAEDSAGRTPLQVAEQYNQNDCADFLRVCMRELSNPKSSFAKMHGRQISGSGLPPIEEDTNSGSSGTQWKDDTGIKGHAESDDEDENKNRRPQKARDDDLLEKRRIYEEQHQRMDSRGVSFLDSIRQEVE